MSETTTGRNKKTSGDPNTKTSNNKRSTGDTKTGEQLEEISEINLVDQGTPKEIIVEIETENKSEKKVVPAKKKLKKKPAKQKAESEQIKDIQNLLEGVFLVASLKAGEHWKLSSDESKQIATPLSRILERYDLLTKASEVSDPVALIVAAATIVIPRIMVTQMSKPAKQEKILKENGVIGNDKKTNNTEHSGSDQRSVVSPTQSNDGEFIKSLSDPVQEFIL